MSLIKRLILLNLKDRTSLVSLPSKLEMESLENLTLAGYSKVKKIPEFAKDIERLSAGLDRDYCVCVLKFSVFLLFFLFFLVFTHFKE